MKRGELSNIIFLNEDVRQFNRLSDVVSESDHFGSSNSLFSDKYSSDLSENTNFTYIKKNSDFYFENREFAGVNVVDVPEKEYLILYSESLDKTQLESRANVFAQMYNSTYGLFGVVLEPGYNPFKKTFDSNDVVYDKGSLDYVTQKAYAS